MFALLAGATGALAAGKPVAANHPIVGSWSFTPEDGACTEVYHFRADGTSLVTSADEIAQSEFEITDAPSAKGFYRMVDTIVRDNEKRDCTGQITKPGSQTTNYVRFDPSREMLIMCEAETVDRCFGPLHRVHGKQS